MTEKGRVEVGESGAGGRGRGSGRPGRGGATPRRSAGPELVPRLLPVLESAGFVLEDVTVVRAGSRSVVKIVVDRDGGIDLDAVAEATRLVSAELDADDGPVSGPYVLEVTSPGVDRPLVAPRHWRRAKGRLVAVETIDGERFVGRLRAIGDDGVVLLAVPPGRRPVAVAEPPRQVLFADVARAVVEIEFGPAHVYDDDDPAGGLDGGPAEDSAGGAEALDATNDDATDDLSDDDFSDDDLSEDDPGEHDLADGQEDRDDEGEEVHR
jgi:ribosome maturation factor RimP